MTNSDKMTSCVSFVNWQYEKKNIQHDTSAIYDVRIYRFASKTVLLQQQQQNNNNYFTILSLNFYNYLMRKIRKKYFCTKL